MATADDQRTPRQGGAFNSITHFILGPFFIFSFGLAVYWAMRAQQDRLEHWWLALTAFALLLLTMQQRMYSLRVQDRIIRLEETLRITRLAPAANVSGLSLRQLIALRFASDRELPALAERAVKEGLTGAQIKEAIVAWRADDIRI